MKRAGIVTNVSSTVRRPGISSAQVKKLVERTLRSERISEAMISVAFVGSTTIAKLNKTYLRHKGPTDVISFGMGRESKGMPAVGDIYICPDVARANAKRNSVSMSEEVARLVVHGTLHVAGHDHPDDETRTQSPMWKRQEKIVASRNR
jgi:probable rRNA maturation factor